MGYALAFLAGGVFALGSVYFWFAWYFKEEMRNYDG